MYKIDNEEPYHQVSSALGHKSLDLIPGVPEHSKGDSDVSEHQTECPSTHSKLNKQEN